MDLMDETSVQVAFDGMEQKLKRFCKIEREDKRWGRRVRNSRHTEGHHRQWNFRKVLRASNELARKPPFYKENTHQKAGMSSMKLPGVTSF